MTVDDRHRASELDEVLQRAVDRQIAEQRALREALIELRDAVDELRIRAPQPSLDAVQAPLGQLRDAIDELRSRPVSQIDTAGLQEQLRTSLVATTQSLATEVRELRSELATHFERVVGATNWIAAVHEQVSALRAQTASSSIDPAAITALREAITKLATDMAAISEVRDSVSGVSDAVSGVSDAVGGVASDTEGIAQALLDLNVGLREWASGVDETVTALRETAERASTEPAQRLAEMEERIKETAELSLYLTDQIEDLDRVMGKMGDLPSKLEGVVSQAMRRALAARAKLDKESENALEDVLASIDEQVDQVATVMQKFGENDDQLRKLSLGQVELGSRLESFQDLMLERLRQVENDRRRSEEALARAIDRSWRGMDPRALEGLATAPKRSPQRRAASSAASARSSTAKRTADTATSGRKRTPRASAEPTPRRAKSKATPRRSRRRTPRTIPLPESSEDTLS